MGRNAGIIELNSDDREYLKIQTRARTIQAQTVIRARILLLKANGLTTMHKSTVHTILDEADKIRLVLVNLRVHTSEETRKYLAAVPDRFGFFLHPSMVRG